MRFHISKQGTIMVIIRYNNSTLGKRFVVKIYKNWQLEETYPYDNLSDIHLQGFILREINHENKRDDPKEIRES